VVPLFVFTTRTGNFSEIIVEFDVAYEEPCLWSFEEDTTTMKFKFTSCLNVQPPVPVPNNVKKHDNLAVGLGVGLAVLFVCLVAVALVLLYIRQKQRRKIQGPMNLDPVDNSRSLGFGAERQSRRKQKTIDPMVPNVDDEFVKITTESIKLPVHGGKRNTGPVGTKPSEDEKQQRRRTDDLENSTKKSGKKKRGRTSKSLAYSDGTFLATGNAHSPKVNKTQSERFPPMDRLKVPEAKPSPMHTRVKSDALKPVRRSLKKVKSSEVMGSPSQSQTLTPPKIAISTPPINADQPVETDPNEVELQSIQN